MNRAFEFLGEALTELKKRRPDNKLIDLYIRLAVAEVQELAAALAETTPTADMRGVLIADAQPARLAALPRAALPGNGKGL